MCLTERRDTWSPPEVILCSLPVPLQWNSLFNGGGVQGRMLLEALKIPGAWALGELGLWGTGGEGKERTIYLLGSACTSFGWVSKCLAIFHYYDDMISCESEARSVHLECAVENGVKLKSLNREALHVNDVCCNVHSLEAFITVNSRLGCPEMRPPLYCCHFKSPL